MQCLASKLHDPLAPCTIITSASRLEQGNHYPIRPPFYFSLTDPIPLFVLCPIFSSSPLLSCRDPPYPFFATCNCSVCHHPLPTFHIFVPCLFCFVPDVCTFTLSSFLFVFLSYAAILYYFCFSSSSSPSFSSALLLPSLSHYREEEQTEVITAPKNETAATPGFTPEASPNENKDDEKDSLPLMKAPPTFYQPQLCIRHSPFPLSQTSYLSAAHHPIIHCYQRDLRSLTPPLFGDFWDWWELYLSK